MTKPKTRSTTSANKSLGRDQLILLVKSIYLLNSEHGDKIRLRIPDDDFQINTSRNR